MKQIGIRERTQGQEWAGLNGMSSTTVSRLRELTLFVPVSETRTANSSLSERQMVIESNMR